jgi:Xaa-Pro aminopeptidase
MTSTLTPVAPTTEPLVDLDRARALARDADLDALVPSSREAVYHFSGHFGGDGGHFAVLPADPVVEAGLTFDVSTRLKHEYAPAWPPLQITFGEFYVVGAPPLAEAIAPDAVEGLRRLLERQGLTAGRLGVELGHLPTATAERLRAALPHATLVDATALLVALRARKTAPEIARQRYATLVVEDAIDAALDAVVIGETEIDLANRIRARLSEGRVRERSIFVGASERGALVHSWPTERVIVHGDHLRIDVVGEHHEYGADLGRNAAVGAATEQQGRLYGISRRALEAAILAVHPGARASDVWRAAIDSAHADGLHDFQRNMVGHGIGIGGHERPVLGNDDDLIIEPDAVLSIEAPYYLYGVGGFSPEDALLVTREGVERWTTAPEELPVVGQPR